MNRLPDNNLQDFMKATRVLFFAIAGGILVLIFVALVLNQVSGPISPELKAHNKLLVACLAVVSFVAMTIARVTYAKGIRYAKEKLISDSEKLTHHRGALIRYLAICEAPALAGAILFMLTGDFVFLVFSAVLLGFILVMAPTEKRLSEELALDWKDRNP